MGGIYGEICTKKGIYQRKWRLCGIILHGVLPLQGIRPDLEAQGEVTERTDSPYSITTEITKERYLSEADFDTESIQVINDEFYIGDEFGLYLLYFDKKGNLKEVFDVCGG